VLRVRFVDAIWAFSHHGVLPKNLEAAIFGHSGMPGRPWGTCTRSASGRIARRTGVGIRTDSPSVRTGICSWPILPL
jgi:hypothetical protein